MLCDEWMDDMALAFNENDDLDIEIEFLDCILEEIEGVRYYSRSFKILKIPHIGKQFSLMMKKL
jgi:hypothetical protein